MSPTISTITQNILSKSGHLWPSLPGSLSMTSASSLQLRRPVNAAFVTLLTKAIYLPATLVLHRSLLSVSSSFTLVVMVTPQLPEEARRVLKSRNIKIRDIQQLKPSEDRHKLSPLDERFRDTWTKLRVFELVEYDRVVLLDSDMIFRKNMDELMFCDLPDGWIAAVQVCACNPGHFDHYPPDWIPENCGYTPLRHPSGLTHPSQITSDSPRPYALMNSGVVVLNPSHSVANAILAFFQTSELLPAFRFPDQDFLAIFFQNRWRPLPYIYNALKTLRTVHSSLWRDEEVKCLHYIGPEKPWHSRPRAEDPYLKPTRWWWTVYEEVLQEMKREGRHWQYVDRFVAHQEKAFDVHKYTEG